MAEEYDDGYGSALDFERAGCDTEEDVEDPDEPLTPAEYELWACMYKRLGGFKGALWMAIAHADTHNLQRLHAGYPEQVEAYRRYISEDGYWRGIQDKADREGLQ